MVDLLNLYVAIAALVVTAVGACIAVYTLDRGNRNSSASLVYSMQIGFMQAWDNYLDEENGEKLALRMSNILSLIETSSAIYFDAAMTGKSGVLMEEYLRDILCHIAERDDLVDEVHSMRHSPTTFVFLDRFIDAMDARSLAAKFLRLRGPRAAEASEFIYETSGGWLISAWLNFKKPNFPGFASVAVAHLRRSRVVTSLH